MFSTKKYIAVMLFFITYSVYAADQDVISVFPLDNYDQTISTWIKPSDASYDKPLLSAEMQQKRLDLFLEHYFGDYSPWNQHYINQILQTPPADGLKAVEISLINLFDNSSKTGDVIGYGENFRAYDKDWITKIAKNINIAQFDDLVYQPDNRGIAIENLHARALPTDDPFFYSYKIAGQGYPFDNLQMSALWVGTPVYIVAETTDHAWSLVITPEYIGWVKSQGIARADAAFVSQWSTAAKNKLAAITQTQTSIVTEKGRYLFSAYVGSVFPATTYEDELELMIPVADEDGYAEIQNVYVSSQQAAIMPIAATPHHFANIMHTLINRPYGWGGMYFYNDCSQELKSLFTPFGIWLPRNSSEQVTAGKMVDMTAETPEKRLEYLMQNGQRFLTLVYIGSHIILYVGNFPNPHKNASMMAMTYQNIWGLKPTPSTRRAVIGKSVLFPMLLQYPEDSTLGSLAGKNYFQIALLTELPAMSVNMKPKAFLDIRTLMYPETILMN